MNNFETKLREAIAEFATAHANSRDQQLVNVLLQSWEQRGLVGMAELIVDMSKWNTRFNRLDKS